MATQIVPAPASAERTTVPLPAVAVDAMRRLELALTTPDATVVEKVRDALGFPAGWRPRAHLGETATYLTVWSQIELNTLFERVGGTVTTRQVERSTHDGCSTWTATEITLTVDVPDVGPVEVVTDIEDDPEHGYRTDVPVVAVVRYEVASARTAELSAAMDTRNLSCAEFDSLVFAQDTMAARPCRARLRRPAAPGRGGVMATAIEKPARKVLERFPAGEPRGSWPAEEFAQQLRRDGRTVAVVMDLPSDSFLVVEAGA